MKLVSDIKTIIDGSVSNIYLDDMPDTPDNCTILYTFGGESPRHSFEARIERPSFRVIVRNTSSATAISITKTIKNLLDGLTSQQVVYNEYISIFLSRNVENIGKDNRGRSQFSMVFAVNLDREYWQQFINDYMICGDSLAITGKTNLF